VWRGVFGFPVLINFYILESEKEIISGLFFIPYGYDSFIM